MFSALDDKEMEVVIDALDERKLAAGADVIVQGESGNELYVVEEGQLDCFKIFVSYFLRYLIQPESPEPKYLKTYLPGEAFGELALLYNAPRAATIKAKTDCHLWVLDRNTFNFIVKDAAARKREKYEEFLKSVPLLSSMDHYERSKLADAIKEEKFNPEDFIIKEVLYINMLLILGRDRQHLLHSSRRPGCGHEGPRAGAGPATGKGVRAWRLLWRAGPAKERAACCERDCQEQSQGGVSGQKHVQAAAGTSGRDP